MATDSTERIELDGMEDPKSENGETSPLVEEKITMETAGVLKSPKLSKVRGSLLWYGCYHGDSGGLGNTQTEQGEGGSLLWYCCYHGDGGGLGNAQPEQCKGGGVYSVVL